MRIMLMGDAPSENVDQGKSGNVDFYELILRLSRGQREFDGAARRRGGSDGDGEAMAAARVAPAMCKRSLSTESNWSMKSCDGLRNKLTQSVVELAQW